MTTFAGAPGRARATGAGVTSRIVRVADLGGEDLAAWQRLADSSLEPNPYFEPAVLGAAARGMGGGRAVMALSLIHI